LAFPPVFLLDILLYYGVLWYIMTNLDDLYRWFDKNRDSIIVDHLKECVLLKDNAVVGYYPDTDTALSAAQNSGFTMGDFLIQDCVTDEEDTMMYYNQAVCFGS